MWSSVTDRHSLAARLLAMQVVILVVVLVPVWLLSARSATESARAEAVSRSRAVAVTLAGDPWLRTALAAPDPAETLRTHVERIRAANDLSFVVVMDTAGTRWTHPDPDEIGSTYRGVIDGALAGRVTVEDYEGTLGQSVRVVAPVYAQTRDIVALVAAGVPLASVSRVARDSALSLGAITLVSLAAGGIAAMLVSRWLRRKTHGLGPIEFARLHSYQDAMLHSVRAGLVLVGHDGTVVLCNDEARRLLGTPDTQPGDHVRRLGLDPTLTDLMAGGAESTGEVHAAGGRALVVTQVRARLDGEDLGWVTTLRDRTDLVRLTGELDTLRALSDLLRDRAHEADNRLHTVSMLVELGRLDEAVEFATATVEQNQALVDAVADAVDEPPLVALLLGKSAQAAERGVELRLDAELRVPATGIAPGDLLVVLGNLLDNAIDAASDSPTPRWVLVGGHVQDDCPSGRRVMFEVGDSGPGLPEQDVEAAFRRGWSTKAIDDRDDRPQGRGLGLALVTGTVRRLGGIVQVRRHPSTFVVTLPLPDAPGAE